MSAIQVHSNSCIYLIGVTLIASETFPLNVIGRVLIGKNVGVTTGGYRGVIVSNGGRLIFRAGSSLHFSNTSNSEADVFQVLNSSVLSHENTSNVTMTITCDGKIRQLFLVSCSSSVERLQLCEITVSSGSVAKKYRIEKNSFMDMGGRGSDWMPGGDGDIDSTSTIS